MPAPRWLHVPSERSLDRCPRAAVGIFMTATGFHVGVLNRVDGDAARVVHLAFHHNLLDEVADETWGWVEPALLGETLQVVGAFARRIHRAHRDGRLPYALRLDVTRFDAVGRLLLGPTEHGLTCATFVLEVFRSAGVDLLDLDSWANRSPNRIAEDDAAQRALVERLELRDPAHAAAVDSEVGCFRFRPEEVAAATANPPHPVEFARAESLGIEVVAAFGR